MELLKALSTAGMKDQNTSRISPMSLTAGFGEGVCEVLEFLVASLLRMRNFRSGEIIRVSEMEERENDMKKDNSNTNNNEEEEGGEDNDEIEDEIEADDNDDDVFNNKQAMMSQERDFFNQSHRGMVNSKIDGQEWRMELERVGPRLRRTANNSDMGWSQR